MAARLGSLSPLISASAVSVGSLGLYRLDTLLAANSDNFTGGTNTIATVRLMGSMGILLDVSNFNIKPLGSIVSSSNVNQDLLQGFDATPATLAGSVFQGSTGIATLGTRSANGSLGNLLNGVAVVDSSALYGVDNSGIVVDETTRYRISNLGIANQHDGLLLSSRGIAYHLIPVINEQGVLTLTGYAPSFETPDGIQYYPPHGELTLTGYQPTFSSASFVLATHGELVLTGYPPSFQTFAVVNYEPITGALTLTGYAPSVDIGNGSFYRPTQGVLLLSADNPSVTVQQGKWFLPSSGALALTGYSPTALNDASKSFEAHTGELVLTGNAPSYDTPDVVWQVFSSTPPTVTPTVVTLFGSEGSTGTLLPADNLYQSPNSYASVVVDINAPETPKAGTY